MRGLRKLRKIEKIEKIGKVRCPSSGPLYLLSIPEKIIVFLNLFLKNPSSSPLIIP